MTTRLEPVWRTVPVEPTEAMFEAFYGAVDILPTGTIWGFLNGWEAMLAAAPAPDGMREAIARLLCTQRGLDPDEHIIGGQATNFEDFGPRWKAARHGHWHGFTDYEEAADAILAIIAKGGGR